MKEAKIVAIVKNTLDSLGLYNVVYHGSNVTANGTPDILTLDKTGRFCGIECKAPGGALSITQWRRGVEIIRSGGRFIIACKDFNISQFVCESFDRIEIDITSDDEFTLNRRYTMIESSKEVVISNA